MTEQSFMLRVNCMTYNHAPFIEKAMDGFCMQKTSFPYICIICDDFSTDGEQKVISNYLELHFDVNDKEIVRCEETDDYVMTFARHKENKNCFFVVFLLKYNHYSIGKPKWPYYLEFAKNVNYIAICEGDDYWTDSLKLQKQFVFLESHLDYTMICNRTQLYSEKEQKYVGENYCYDQSQTVEVQDVIFRGGLFISTCSIIYRSGLTENYPDYCGKCKVGDYPLQILAAMKGKIYYFNDMMSVYRVQNNSSWTGYQNWKPKNYDNRLATIQSIINMFKGFAEENPQYADFFQTKTYQYITGNIPSRRMKTAIQKKYYKEFKESIKKFPFLWKFDSWIGFLGIPLLIKVRNFYYPRFNQKLKLYK